MLFVSETSIDSLYAAARLILCEESLFDSFTKAVPTQATIVRYKGDTIGGSGSGRVGLTDFGVPVALEMIVGPKGCATAKELLAIVAESGFPQPVSLLELQPRRLLAGRSDRLEILTAYQAAVEATISGLQTNALKRGQEIVALRRRVESQTLTNNHLSDFLSMLGYASQELALEHIPDLDADFVAAPFRQNLPMVLSDISGVSLYCGPSETIQRASVSVGVPGNELYRQEIDLDRSGGWHDLFFPEGFLQQNRDGQLSVETIEGAPTFATADGIADGSASIHGMPGRSAALRVWRHADPKIHPLREDATVFLPRPRTVEGNVLGADAIIKALGGRRIEEVISLADDSFVRTHPVPDHFANYIIRDVTLDAVEAVEAVVRLTHPKASPVQFHLHVLPEDTDGGLLDSVRNTIERGTSAINAGTATTTLGVAGSALLSVDTTTFHRSLRYCVVLSARSSEKKPRYAWSEWQYVALRLKTKPQRQTYRFSYFAALANQIQYADGPILENQMNETFFTMLAVSDGDRYLQTHPLENHVVGARLDSFVPKGMQRLWIDISNSHAEASPTEFGVLLSPTIISERFTDHYDTADFAQLSDDAVHMLPDGALLKKTVLHALESTTLNIFLTEALPNAAHLYLFVKVRRGPVKYGWCRWHRLAMTIFSGQDAPGDQQDQPA